MSEPRDLGSRPPRTAADVWRGAARGATGEGAADPEGPERVHRALAALSDRLGAVIPVDDRPCPVCGEAPDGHEHPAGTPG